MGGTLWAGTWMLEIPDWCLKWACACEPGGAKCCQPRLALPLLPCLPGGFACLRTGLPRLAGLRRWEAACLAPVVTAALDASRMAEQRPMQAVLEAAAADVPPCPPHLQPSLAWLQAFLTHFARLRLQLQRCVVGVRGGRQPVYEGPIWSHA
jgi:hypothetical protein